MFTRLILITLLSLSFVSQSQAGWDPTSGNASSKRLTKVASTIASFKKKDSALKIFFSKAYGYAVFPTVGKGGIGIGGAFGKGEVFKKGRFIGRTSLTQLTYGFQLGGQAYSQIIFFKNKKALDDFTAGSFKLGAQASAVAITAGASANVDYNNGVAIFTQAKGGLMYEATVGGQKFSFTPR